MGIQTGISVAALVLLTQLAIPATAEEFHARIQLEHVGKHAVPVNEPAVKKLVHGAMTGTVTSDTHTAMSPARDLKTWTVVITEDGGPTLVGTDTMTTADGSMIHVRYQGVPSFATDDGIARGTWSVLGGSGRYAQAAGDGEFRYRATDSGGVKTLTGELTH